MVPIALSVQPRHPAQYQIIFPGYSTISATQSGKLNISHLINPATLPL
jgi:hypothetical protein